MSTSKQDSIANQIVNRISDDTDLINSLVENGGEKTFAQITRLLSDLETVNGNIKVSINNIRVINKIKSLLKDAGLSPQYQKDVEKFLKAFDDIANLNNKYFGQVTEDFEPKDIYSEVKNLAKDSVKEALLGDGFNANITNKIGDILDQNMNTGSNIDDLTNQLRVFLTNTKEGDGALVRYAKTYTTNAINKYNATYNGTITADLGLEWYKYVGSLLETSREFCKTLIDAKKNGMEYIHVSQFDELLKGNINGTQIPINDKTKLPNGMEAGTNVSNLTINRGGWNCGHQFMPVSSEIVPQQYKDKILKGKKPVEKVVEKAVEKPIEKTSGNVFEQKNAKEILNDELDNYLESIGYPKLNKKDYDLYTLKNLSNSNLQRQYNAKNQFTTQGLVKNILGQTKKPSVINKDDFNRLKDTGDYYHAKRGICFNNDASDKNGTAKEAINQYKYGDEYNGYGLYGNGTYVDLDESGGFETATQTYNCNNEELVIDILIPKNTNSILDDDAYVIKQIFTRLSEQYTKFYKNEKNIDKPIDLIISEEVDFIKNRYTPKSGIAPKIKSSDIDKLVNYLELNKKLTDDFGNNYAYELIDEMGAIATYLGYTMIDVPGRKFGVLLNRNDIKVLK